MVSHCVGIQPRFVVWTNRTLVPRCHLVGIIDVRLDVAISGEFQLAVRAHETAWLELQKLFLVENISKCGLIR